MDVWLTYMIQKRLSKACHGFAERQCRQIWAWSVVWSSHSSMYSNCQIPKMNQRILLSDLRSYYSAYSKPQHLQENIRLLLEYAKPLTRINDSSPNFGDSYIFDTQRFERAIGPVFVNALPAIKILSSSLRYDPQMREKHLQKHARSLYSHFYRTITF